MRLSFTEYLRLHVTFMMINSCFNNTIFDSLKISLSVKSEHECKLNSLLTLATIYSASRASSNPSLSAMSLNEMREYDNEIRRMPVLITLCRSLTIKV